MEKNKVFVYGTLKRGHGNHRLLESSKFLGEALTEESLTLYDLGPFPAVVDGGTNSIVGEVYEVDEGTFRRLDGLEGYPNFYDRKVIQTSLGEAWVYFIHEPSEHWRLIDNVWPAKKESA